MAIGMSGSLTYPGIPVDHGIVKGGAPHFKQNLHTIVKSRFHRVGGMTSRAGLIAGALGVKVGGATAGRDRLEGGCRMRHAPLRALRCIRMFGRTEALGIQVYA